MVVVESVMVAARANLAVASKNLLRDTARLLDGGCEHH